MESYSNLFAVLEKTLSQREVLPILSQPGFFNLTSSFRSDSDFAIPGLYYQNISGRGFRTDPPFEMSSKDKLMVWFVSHCKTDSKREDYIAELSKYMHVDIYGKCGIYVACRYKGEKNCAHVPLSKYKFYFAAENSICREYFTGNYFDKVSSSVKQHRELCQISHKSKLEKKPQQNVWILNGHPS